MLRLAFSLFIFILKAPQRALCFFTNVVGFCFLYEISQRYNDTKEVGTRPRRHRDMRHSQIIPGYKNKTFPLVKCIRQSALGLTQIDRSILDL